jgi:hypothetical protein
VGEEDGVGVADELAEQRMVVEGRVQLRPQTFECAAICAVDRKGAGLGFLLSC